MPQLTQNYHDIIIPVDNHPDLLKPRLLRMDMMVIRRKSMTIEIQWELVTLDVTNLEYPRLTEKFTQPATANDIVILDAQFEVQELLFRDEFNSRYAEKPEYDAEGNPTGNMLPGEQPEPAMWGTEYDFWWMKACSDNPPPMHLILADAGQKFAIRRGWLTLP